MWHLSLQNKAKNIRPTILFETKNFRLKKNRSRSYSKPGHFPFQAYLQAMCAGNTKKLELIMNPGTNRSC